MATPAIQKQVEFYFSDSNFRRDKFLKEETTKHQDGYIPFSVLFTFKKLAELTTDAATLAAALESSDVVELNETKDGVRRKYPLPENDDSASRTAVFAGLGCTMPTIEEIKQALGVIGVEPLYTHRKMYRKKFAGVARIEFKDVATLQYVQTNADKISILQHTPVILPLKEFEALSADQQVEFEKAVSAMLVAKDVPHKPMGEYYDAFLTVWQQESVLRGRIKHVAESKQLYVMFTQIKFAEKLLELTKSTFPIVVGDQTLSFELVTDKEAIAARPRSHRSDDKKDNKRKREPEGKAIHISNIPSRVRLDDVKKLVIRGMESTDRSPFITYEGLDTAKFVIHNTEEATAVFNKLNGLEDAELGGQKVVFHLLDPNEELQVDVSYEKGLIVRFDGVEGEISRDVIKDTINDKLREANPVKPEEEDNMNGVAFIQYQQNDKSGHLRVTSAPLAQQVVDLINKGLDMNGVTLNSATLLEGEEEKTFWVEARTARSNRFKQIQKNKQQGRGRGPNKRGRF